MICSIFSIQYSTLNQQILIVSHLFSFSVLFSLFFFFKFNVYLFLASFLESSFSAGTKTSTPSTYKDIDFASILDTGTSNKTEDQKKCDKNKNLDIKTTTPQKSATVTSRETKSLPIETSTNIKSPKSTQPIDALSALDDLEALMLSPEELAERKKKKEEEEEEAKRKSKVTLHKKGGSVQFSTSVAPPGGWEKERELERLREEKRKAREKEEEEERKRMSMSLEQKQREKLDWIRRRREAKIEDSDNEEDLPEILQGVEFPPKPMGKSPPFPFAVFQDEMKKGIDCWTSLSVPRNRWNIVFSFLRKHCFQLKLIDVFTHLIRLLKHFSSQA